MNRFYMLDLCVRPVLLAAVLTCGAPADQAAAQPAPSPCGELQYLEIPAMEGGAYAMTPDATYTVGWVRLPVTNQIHALRWSDAGEYLDLGTVAGGVWSEASGISADGSVVVGVGLDSANSNVSFRWTQAGGMQLINQVINGIPHYAGLLSVSGDSGTIVGQVSNRAFRWTISGGLQLLGQQGFTSAAYAVSANGHVVVGSGLNQQFEWRAHRWTSSGGSIELGTFGGNHSQGRGVSADGNVVVGWARTPGGPDHAFRWTMEGGMQDLGTLGGIESWAFGVSADGNVVVGRVRFSPVRDLAFRWTASTGMELLDDDLCGDDVGAFGTSADGSVVVGSACGSPAANRPFRWVAALPPSVTQQPTSVATCPRATEMFSIAAAGGGGTITYQWQVEDAGAPGGWRDLADGVLFFDDVHYADLTGTHASTMHVEIVSGSMPRRFRAVVTSDCGGVASDEAVLTICAADVNCSGDLSVQDIFDFLAFYFSSDPRGDFNGVGGWGVQDIFDFLAAYFSGAGC